MNRRDALLALVPPFCWGTGFAVAKPAVEHFPPLMMMALIYAGIALALFFTPTPRIKTSWAALALVAAFSMPIQGLFLFLGLRELDVTTATLVLQSQVPLAVLLGSLLAGESLNLRKVAGTIVAIAGVVAVVGLPDQKPPWSPVALIVLGAFAWALGQVLARVLGRDDGLTLLKGLSYLAVPQLVLGSYVIETGQLDAIAGATWHHWLALAFVGVVGFYAAYSVWYSLLRRCRVDDLAPFALLMPLFSIACAWIFLGEAISLAQIAGGIVILFGLAIVTGLSPLRWRTAGGATD